MIGDSIRKISMLTGPHDNLIVIETDRDIYHVSGSGFKRGDFDGGGTLLKEFSPPEPVVMQVKSDVEYTILKLTNGDYLMVGTASIDSDGRVRSGLKVMSAAEADSEFEEWFNNDMQELSRDRSYYSME